MNFLTSRLVAALAAASVLAAVPLSAARAETPKDMFVMATLLDEFTTLDPGEIYELVPEEYVANTYDRLVRVDLRDPSKFNGDVAQSWTVSTDGLTYTFKLRPGLKFHDNEKVTTRDVIASLDRWMVRDTMGQRIKASLDAMEALWAAVKRAE